LDIFRIVLSTLAEIVISADPATNDLHTLTLDLAAFAGRFIRTR